LVNPIHAKGVFLMNQPNGSTRTLQNRILSALPQGEYERIAPRLENVALPLGEILYHPEEPISWVYFPLGGTISLTVPMENGAEAEVGVVGREGMLGLPVILGTHSTPLRAMVQVPNGGGLRMRADVFEEEVRCCEKFHCLLLRYAQAFFVQTAVTAACNRLHHLDGRLAKWLLTCRDRAQTDALRLTQEFMAVMLGVRRAGVTVAASRLQARGLINYARGKVNIIDVQGLESASCECYGVIRREYDRLLAEAPPWAGFAPSA
jgi:CRP-like cAMP-binding protein